MLRRLVQLIVPAHQRAYPGQQHARLHGFDDVIVGAGLQPQDLVQVVLARGQHQDRHIGKAADLPAPIDAAQARQHQVQHHQFRCMLAARRAGQVAAGHVLYGEAMFVQIVADQLGQAAIVFHQQDRGRRAAGGGCPARGLHAYWASVPGQDRPAAKPSNGP
ncbi:hypothetical protein G6F66_014139 [Rhizopus arrhizus]|nr:hypothetical protein G6F66_014139 [Rhizopus arrhizus]